MKQNFYWLKKTCHLCSEITWRPSFDITVSDTNCVNDVNFGLIMSYLTDIIITATHSQLTLSVDTSVNTRWHLTQVWWMKLQLCHPISLEHTAIIYSSYTNYPTPTLSNDIYYWSLSKAGIFQVKPRINVAYHFPTHSNSIWSHLSYGLVRSKREYRHNCSLVVVLCSFL